MLDETEEDDLLLRFTFPLCLGGEDIPGESDRNLTDGDRSLLWSSARASGLVAEVTET